MKRAVFFPSRTTIAKATIELTNGEFGNFSFLPDINSSAVLMIAQRGLSVGISPRGSIFLGTDFSVKLIASQRRKERWKRDVAEKGRYRFNWKFGRRYNKKNKI